MMRGKIIRGVGGFYYIHPESAAADVLIECKAKGIFRNRNIKPLVGDNVEFEMLDEQAGTGNITEILPRRNALIRPASANVDQAVVVFALSFPKPNLNLLDRFLLMMQTQDIPVIICFNKSDDQEEGGDEKNCFPVQGLWCKSTCDEYHKWDRYGGASRASGGQDNRDGRSFRSGEILRDEYIISEGSDGDRRDQPQDQTRTPYDASYRVVLYWRSDLYYGHAGFYLAASSGN